MPTDNLISGSSLDLVRNPDHPRYDVIVVGAGFAGLYCIYALRALGFRVRAFEAGSGVGGTWFWNRYPGARCDVESLEYSYSFSEALQQEWHWSERYAPQSEILRYANHVADRFELRPHVQFETRVQSASFDNEANFWSVRTDQGDVVTARYCIMATGCLSLPRLPDFPGLDSFKGKLYHTGLWPAEGADLAEKRIGVIGTGSSGIQVIPQLARQAAHLYVFQRTPNFSLPAFNRTLDEDTVRQCKQHYAALRAKARQTSAGIAGHPVPDASALELEPESRERVYEAGWQRGSTGFTRLFTDILTDEAANDTAAEFVRRKIRATVKDPKVAELLTPRDHFIGTKRICLDTDYYETFNRPNVSLVDVRGVPIETITPTGLRTAQTHYELDAIVFATGYDAVTGALNNIDIRNGEGVSLAEKWTEGPRTYLGLMSAGFPNLFLVTGPGSPSVLTNVITAIEQHVEWISACLEHLQARGAKRIEAEPAAEDAWVAHVDQVARTTLFPRADSWYTGANIPGKPRIFLAYLGGLGNYRQRCDEVASADYEGFVIA